MSHKSPDKYCYWPAASHGIEPVDPSVFHDEDLIRVLNTGNPLGDDQLGGSRNLLGKSTPDLRVCGRVHGAGGIIQDQYLRIFQQRPGNAEPLFLAAGHVGPSLFDLGLVFVRELLNKFICTGLTACLHAFLLSGLFISPSQVIQYGA